MKGSEVPVLIVGAGAAGSILALELARQNIDFRVIDRLPVPSRRSRAITVHARTLELLDRVDPALSARFLARGIHCPGYVIHFVDKAGRRSEVRPGLDFRSLDSRYPFLLLHRQDETEATLWDYLRERFDIVPEWGSNCLELSQEKEQVRVRIGRSDGSEENLSCRYLAACGGANSLIRRRLDPAQAEGDYAGAVLQNLDIEIKGFPDDPDWVHYCAGPGHFVMAARLPGGFYRLLMSQPAEVADAEATAETVFRDTLNLHFDGIRFGRKIWHSRWQSQVRLAQAYRHGNVFLAGDAAHLHSTAGGQGMNCCMQDSFNLGWKLALVLRGQAPKNLLNSYESERRPIGKQVIEAASEIHELFMAGRERSRDEMLALQASGFVDALVNKVSGLAYHYRTTPDVEERKLPSAGDRAPDTLLADGRRLSDLLRHRGYTLLLVAATEQPSESAGNWLRKLAEEHGELLRTAQLNPAPAAWTDRTGAAPLLYLIRPDGYLALRCSFDQRQLVEQALTPRAVPSPASS